MIGTALLILFALAAVTPVVTRLAPRFGPLMIAAVPFGLGCWFAPSLAATADGVVRVETTQWAPELGLDLAFRLDGLTMLFALLICFISSLVLAYASSYMRADPARGRFLAILVAFTASMLGLVAAENLLLLFVFWELTSITSFLLIGHEHARESARRAALQALLVTGGGGLALLAGLILMGIAAGGFTLTEVFAADLTDHALYPAIVALVLVAACTKSAMFPFHFWLPNAMEAPSPVSALLHSATMVKAGVYLVLRLHPALGGPLIWDESLALIGGFTMLYAAFLATRQTQLKKILAYSTVSSLGVLVMLVGLGAIKAAATYLLAHAMFKGALFMIAGSVSKRTGQKDPERLGGLVRVMPMTGAVAMLAALSMAGMFPLIGFVGKELVLKAGIGHPEWAVPATIATTLAGGLTVMAALLAGFRPFVGAKPDDLGVREGDWRQFMGPALLAVGGMLASMAPMLFTQPIVKGVIATMPPALQVAELKLRPLELLWPPTLATGLSVLALAAGFALYLARRPYRALGSGSLLLDRFGFDVIYDKALAAVLGAAAWHTRVVQNGSLQIYLRVVLLAVVLTVGAAILRSGVVGLELDVGSLAALDVLLIVCLIGATIAVTQQRSALASVAVLGGIGFTIALIFAQFGAPDVAMTQLAVETLIVVIFVLVIFHLQKYRRLSNKRTLLADAGLACLVGLAMAEFTLAVMSRPPAESVSAFFSERAVTEGFGRNVVNVILVDFRALDTLGEIFVIGVAAIGVYVLVRAPKPPSPAEGADA